MRLHRRAALSVAVASLALAACKQNDGGPTTPGSAARPDDGGPMKKMTVLILGLKWANVDSAQARLQLPEVEVFGGTGIEDVRATFAKAKVDHVVMGAGIDLDTRLAIVHEVFHLSESTTIHMKDHASGVRNFEPFIRAVLRGLRGWERA